MKKSSLISFVIIISSLLLVSCISVADNSKLDSDGEVLMSVSDYDAENLGSEEDTMANRIVVMKTSLGTIKIEMYEDKMPITTGNFIKLAQEGYYDGQRFHRVIANFMIQGGDPLSKDTDQRSMWGTGGPGYYIEDEFVEGLSNLRGTIAMANSGPNSGGSQFFINLVDNTYLDWDKQPTSSKHPVFGEVVAGIDVVDAIGAVEVGSGSQPTEDVLIEKVTIE